MRVPSWLIAGASKSTSSSSKRVVRAPLSTSIDDEREAAVALLATRSTAAMTVAPSGVSATWSGSIVRPGAGVRSRGRGRVAG